MNGRAREHLTRARPIQAQRVERVRRGNEEDRRLGGADCGEESRGRRTGEVCKLYKRSCEGVGLSASGR